MRLSALHHTHLSLGATMTDEEGWQLPSRYAAPEEELRRIRAGCGLCDLSHLGKWDAKGSVRVWECGSMGEKPFPEISKVERTRWQGAENLPAESLCYRLAADHALLTSEAPLVDATGQIPNQPSPASPLSVPLSPLRAPLRVEAPAGIYLTEVTSAYAALCLAGPRSREVLSKLTSLNLTERALPDFSCAQTNVAKCHAILARTDANGLPAHRIFVTRDYAEFVWDALMTAGKDCGLTPVGLEAWRSLNAQRPTPNA